MALDAEKLYGMLFEAGFAPEWAEEETEIVFCCVLCDDDKPRLYVSADTGVWVCFHCHEEGSLYRLFLRVLELDSHEAYEAQRKLLTQDTTDPWRELIAEPGVEEKEPDKGQVVLPTNFRPVSDVTPERFLRYLSRRHISRELAIQRGVGYCLQGRYANRLVLPVESDGHLFTFVARSVWSRCPGCQNAAEDCECERTFRKVLTPTGGRPGLTLYNLDFVRASASSRVVLVEGAFDALRLPREAVALLTSSISATQVTLLAGVSRGRELVLCLDGDSAGRKGAAKIADALWSAMVPCHIAHLEDGEDPSSLDHKDLERALREAEAYIR